MAALALLTAAALSTRAVNRSLERAANAFSSERVGVLQEMLCSIIPLRVIGWSHWFIGRVEFFRDKELALISRAQALRVAVDLNAP